MSESGRVPDRVNAIREVLGYLGRYRNELFVLKIDDALVEEPLFPLLIRDVVLLYRMGIHVVIVPGARHAIDSALESAGIRSRYHQGVRITTEEGLAHVMTAASRVSNRILSLLSENGAQAVSGNWVRARTLGVIEGIDFQRTGRIEKVNVTLLSKLLGEGVIPLATNIGWNAVGKAHNLSSTELAVAVASAMGAAKLFFVGMEPGIPAVGEALPELRVRDSGVYSNMDLSQVERLLAAAGNSLDREHRVLLESAVAACTGGVKRVHIVDGRENGILLEEIFSISGRGTMLFANLYTNICPASVEDVPEIIRLIQPFVQQSLVLQRTPETIAENVERWVVYKVDDAIRGCAALTPYDAESGEIEALVVDEDHRGGGTGGRLVTFLIDRARRLGMKRVFALTTQASDFFMALGFAEVPPEELPAAKRQRYNRRRNSRVLALDLAAGAHHPAHV
jgi:amino-acid N-acetyltransferase